MSRSWVATVCGLAAPASARQVAKHAKNPGTILVSSLFDQAARGASDGRHKRTAMKVGLGEQLGLRRKHGQMRSRGASRRCDGSRQTASGARVPLLQVRPDERLDPNVLYSDALATPAFDNAVDEDALHTLGVEQFAGPRREADDLPRDAWRRAQPRWTSVLSGLVSPQFRLFPGPMRGDLNAVGVERDVRCAANVNPPGFLMWPRRGGQPGAAWGCGVDQSVKVRRPCGHRRPGRARR
jgi:hypothetical protein